MNGHKQHCLVQIRGQWHSSVHIDSQWHYLAKIMLLALITQGILLMTKITQVLSMDSGTTQVHFYSHKTCDSMHIFGQLHYFLHMYAHWPYSERIYGQDHHSIHV